MATPLVSLGRPAPAHISGVLSKSLFPAASNQDTLTIGEYPRRRPATTDSLESPTYCNKLSSYGTLCTIKLMAINRIIIATSISSVPITGPALRFVMTASLHRWRRLGAAPAGRMVAECKQPALRACRRCDLVVCADAASCSKCGPFFHLVCDPRPKRMGPPEKPPDLRYPRRAATKRMVAKSRALMDSASPCHKCGGDVFEGDKYCRHCGVRRPSYVQVPIL